MMIHNMNTLQQDDASLPSIFSFNFLSSLDRKLNFPLGCILIFGVDELLCLEVNC
jgi:hypothetical protein